MALPHPANEIIPLVPKSRKEAKIEEIVDGIIDPDAPEEDLLANTESKLRPLRKMKMSRMRMTDRPLQSYLRGKKFSKKLN